MFKDINKICEREEGEVVAVGGGPQFIVSIVLYRVSLLGVVRRLLYSCAHRHASSRVSVVQSVLLLRGLQKGVHKKLPSLLSRSFSKLLTFSI